MDKIKEKLHLGSKNKSADNDVSTGHVGTIEGKWRL
jgi:hypothetical protein